MNIEVITDHMPACGLGIAGNDCLHVGQKIFLRSRGSSVRGDDLSRHDIAAENDATRSMPLIRRHRVAALFRRPEAILDVCAQAPGRLSVRLCSPSARPAEREQARRDTLCKWLGSWHLCADQQAG